MIDKTSALETMTRKVKKLPVGHCLDMRTYKRNRSLVIKKMGADSLLVVQDGYEQARHEIPLGKFRKLLKTLLKKEFPRSTKIRLYDLGPCDPMQARAMKTL